MKRYSHIFEQITDMETLKYAYQKALKGKRNRRDAIEFMMNSHKNLLEIQEELLNDTYIMSPYHKFYIADPKKRLIMSLPFKDRVVQWSIFAVINPIFEKRFISTSYACRVGGGTHAAIDKLQEYVQINGKEGYVLKMDISKYFYRVVHEKLYQIIANTIKDTRALKLLADIIYCQEPLGIALDDILLTGERESGLGLPIGNLTSQMFANIYLNELDQFAKHELKTKYYVRYMDDICIVHKDKGYLHEVKDRMKEFARDELFLEFNNKTVIRKTKVGVDFCGYVAFQDHMKLRKKSALRMKHQMKHHVNLLMNGEETLLRFTQTLNSFIGSLSHCDTYTLTKTVLSVVPLEVLYMCQLASKKK